MMRRRSGRQRRREVGRGLQDGARVADGLGRGHLRRRILRLLPCLPQSAGGAPGRFSRMRGTVPCQPNLALSAVTSVGIDYGG